MWEQGLDGLGYQVCVWGMENGGLDDEEEEEEGKRDRKK